MLYLFDLFLIATGVYPKFFDAYIRAEGPLSCVTEAPLRNGSVVRNRKGPRHFVSDGENSPRATYLPQHIKALSG
jgi:hypothetical protein